MTAIRLLTAAAFALAAPSAASAQPQPRLSAAIASGVVGERFDGYLGYAAEPSAAVKRQVSAVNMRRRAVYLDLAARRGVSARYAGLAAGCELFARVAVGQTYMLSDGVWRRRSPGEPAPVRDYCSG